MLKALRIAGVVIMSIITLIILILALIQLRPVQNWVIQQVISSMGPEFEEHVTFENLYIDFPLGIEGDNLLVTDQHRDTILYVKRFEIAFNMWDLLNLQISPADVNFDRVRGNISADENGTFNYQFLLDEMGGGTDTTASKGGRGINFTFELAGSTLDIKDLNLQYSSAADSTDGVFQWEHFYGTLKEADLENFRFNVKDLSLANANIYFHSFIEKEDSSIIEVPEMFYKAENWIFKDVIVDIAVPGFILYGDINELNLNEGEATIHEDVTMTIKTENIFLESDTIYYKFENFYNTEEGIDYDNMSLTGVITSINEIQISEEGFEIDVDTLSSHINDRINIENLRGSLTMIGDVINLNNIFLNTDMSYLNAEGEIRLPPADDSDNIFVDLQLSSRLYLPQVFYIYPELRNFIQDRHLSGNYVTINGGVKGDMNRLYFQDFHFAGLQATEIETTGYLSNLTDPERLGYDLRIQRLNTTRNDLLTIVPPGTIPPDVELPQTMSFRGEIEGDLKSTQLDLQGSWRRDNVTSRIDIAGQVENLNNPDALAYDLNVRNMEIYKQDILKSLPDTIIPEGYDLPEKINYAGNISGNMKNIKTDGRIQLEKEGEVSTINFKADIRDFSDPKNIAYNITIDSADIGANFYNILPDSLWPEIINKQALTFSKLNFSGQGSGFAASGVVRVADGTITFEVVMDSMRQKIDASVSRLDLDLFLDDTLGIPYTIDTISPVSAGVHWESTGRTMASLTGGGNLWIASPTTFDTIHWKGEVTEGYLEGRLWSREPVIALDLPHTFNMNPDSLRLTANGVINRIDLKALELSDSAILLSTGVEADIRGFHPDTLEGFVELTDVDFKYAKGKYELQEFIAEATILGRNKTFLVLSDIFTLQVDGQFHWDTLGLLIDDWMYTYLGQGEAVAGADSLPVDMEFTLEFYESNFPVEEFIPGVENLSAGFITGRYQSDESEIALYSEWPSIELTAFSLDSLVLVVRSEEDAGLYDIDVANVEFGAAFLIPRASLDGKIEEGVVTGELQTWNQQDSLQYELGLTGSYYDQQYVLKLDKTLLMNYREYRTPDDHAIIIDSTGIIFDNVMIMDDSKRMVFEAPEPEQVRVTFTDFPVSALTGIAEQKQDIIGGDMYGHFTYNIEQALIESDLELRDFHLNEVQMGVFRLKAKQLPAEDAFFLNGIVEQNNKELLKIEGTASIDEVDLDLSMEEYPVASLRNFVYEFVSGLGGYLNSEITIKGDPFAPDLQGFLAFDSTAFTPVFLQAPYLIRDGKINISNTRFDIPQLVIYDSLQNRFTLDGSIVYESFQEMDLYLDYVADKFMFLNTGPEDNDLFYGTLYANAAGNIGGSLFQPLITGNITTAGDSRITYIFPQGALGLVASSEGVVRFRNDTLAEEASATIANKFGLELDLNIRMTPDLRLRAVIDPIAGDEFVGRLEGPLNLHMAEDGDMTLWGRLDFTEGIYIFTYSNVFRREFTIQENSGLAWLGDPFEPQLNIHAAYQVEASPAPLLALGPAGPDEDRFIGEETFLLTIHIQGEMLDPDIELGIEYPQNQYGNQGLTTVQQAIENLQADGNETELNKQAFGLLMFGSFIASDFTLASRGGGALGGSLTQFVTNQLNTIANKYVNFVDLEIDLDNTYTAMGNEETELSIKASRRLFNERLSISVAGHQQVSGEPRQSRLIDDVSLQYSITPSGSIKVSVFSKNQFDQYTDENVILTGAAIILSQDFNSISELNPL